MKTKRRVIRNIGGMALALTISVGVFQGYASLNEREQTQENNTAVETMQEQESRALGPASLLVESTESEEVARSKTEAAESETAETKPREISEEEIDAYFQDSVFVGDSVMVGFRNYALRRQDSFLANIKFLAAGSLSAHNAFWEISANSVHPIYQGEKRMIWDSISMMQAKKVFLFLGLNDLNIGGVDGSCAKYKELIDKIKEKVPDVEISVISMTYTLAGKGKGKLNNEEIRKFNEKLAQMAQENGWGFVNLAPALADENGDLAPQYCSDQFVHQTTAAYDVWVSVLRSYAKERLQAAAQN
ncbi:MAG: GDSL-type esterase/lipase family protein [bacterium]|nr:GDSL-type esterase/lipase family protein [bacterium]